MFRTRRPTAANKPSVVMDRYRIVMEHSRHLESSRDRKRQRIGTPLDMIKTLRAGIALRASGQKIDLDISQVEVEPSDDAPKQAPGDSCRPQ
jgi:hypothetical protein